MRIVVDRDRCASLGMCEAVAPDLFEVGDDGALLVLDAGPAEDRRALVEEAVAACPTASLRVEG